MDAGARGLRLSVCLSLCVSLYLSLSDSVRAQGCLRKHQLALDGPPPGGESAEDKRARQTCEEQAEREVSASLSLAFSLSLAVSDYCPWRCL